MVDFSEMNVGELIYIIEEEPVIILELKVVGLGYDDDCKRRIKVANCDITFEVDFDDIKERVFIDKEYAHSVATKYIFDETNKYIRQLTDGQFIDYFDLDNALEHYKTTHPEIFI